jgi:hypothetical protein
MKQAESHSSHKYGFRRQKLAIFAFSIYC